MDKASKAEAVAKLLKTRETVLGAWDDLITVEMGMSNTPDHSKRLAALMEGKQASLAAIAGQLARLDDD